MKNNLEGQQMNAAAKAKEWFDRANEDIMAGRLTSAMQANINALKYQVEDHETRLQQLERMSGVNQNKDS